MKFFIILFEISFFEQPCFFFRYKLFLKIAKRFKSGNETVLSFLLNEEYLNFLNEKERNTLLSSFNYKNVTNDNIRLIFPRLKIFVDSGNNKVKQAFKEEIARRLENGNEIVVRYLIMNEYLIYFQKQELENLLFDEKYDLKIKMANALKDMSKWKKFPFTLLKKLAEIGEPNAKEVYQGMMEKIEEGELSIIHKLLNRINIKHSNMKEFEPLLFKIYSILLEDEKAQALLDITLLINEPVMPVPFPGDIDTAIEEFKYDAVATFLHENHHVIGLYFLHSKIKRLLESIRNLLCLHFLVISRSQIQYIPSSFKKLKNLVCNLRMLLIDVYCAESFRLMYEEIELKEERWRVKKDDTLTLGVKSRRIAELDSEVQGIVKKKNDLIRSLKQPTYACRKCGRHIKSDAVYNGYCGG